MGNDMQGDTAIDKLACWTLADAEVFRHPLAINQAKLLILDSIGCAYAAKAAHSVDEVLEAVSESKCADESTIIGHSKSSVLNAILGNGALVRVLDLNDIQYVQIDGTLTVSGHSSDNIPVALAVGERLGIPGIHVIETIVMAYELYDRFRKLMPENSHWDYTSVSGPVSAAITGRLLGLTQERQANAIALSTVRTAVPFAVRKGVISASKSIANAMVAQGGAQSAFLAARGVTGPREALEPPDGLISVFIPERDLSILWQPVGNPPAIVASHIKDYPCIGTGQTLVRAALDLHASVKGQIHLIDGINIVMSDVPIIRRQHADRGIEPQSREAADHNFLFLACVTLMDGALSSRQFENSRWLEPDVKKLMSRVRLSVDADLRDRAPGSMPCRLEITLTDGRKVVSERLYAAGHSSPEKGLDTEAVRTKFNSVCESILPKSMRDRIVEEVFKLDMASSLSDLMKLLGRQDRVSGLMKLLGPRDGPTPA